MHVIGTAGHVDHGKSTVVRALTGMEPDRLAEERRRGLTIDLGYAWTTLPGLGEVAIVDVPGHERFVKNMLTGLAPLSAVMFVVAADQGWQRQSAEHLAAVDALGIRHGVLVVTRSDLADPTAVEAVAAVGQAELGRTSLAGAPVVAVSGTTGAGLDELRAVLATLLRRMPPARPGDRARLWIDRAFSVRGSGLVVTGTLTDGSVSVGDVLALGGAGAGTACRPGAQAARARVRGVESLGVTRSSVPAVARVALNLKGIHVDAIRRGMAAVTPDAWWWAETCDVRLSGDPRGFPVEASLHVGTASQPVRVRPLGQRSARLRLAVPLPLTPGDHGLLRTPDSEGRVLGLVVQDVDPQPLRRRGRAAEVGALLESRGEVPDLITEVERRGALRVDSLRRLGIPVPAGGRPYPGKVPRAGEASPRGDEVPTGETPEPGEVVLAGVAAGAGTCPPGLVRAGPWLVGEQALDGWRSGLVSLLGERARSRPLDPYVAPAAAAAALHLPGPGLIGLVADVPGLVAEERGLRLAQATPSLGDHEPDLRALEARLRAGPLDAPTAEELVATGLTSADLATAVRLRRLVRLGRAGTGAIYLAPGAPQWAVHVLATLPQPFTTTSAREALGTTRRVAIPLLEHLDDLGLTRRVDANTRAVTQPAAQRAHPEG